MIAAAATEAVVKRAVVKNTRRAAEWGAMPRSYRTPPNRLLVRAIRSVSVPPAGPVVSISVQPHQPELPDTFEMEVGRGMR